jgi:signal peptidase I
MPKINNNPIMKGVSGMLGDVVVYRQFRGTTVMSNRPKKPKVLTPHQQAIKSRFLLAVAYAKEQIADPILKAKYQPGPGSEFTSAYIAAIADYLRKRKLEDMELQEEKILNSKELPEALPNVDAKPDNGNDKICVMKHSECFTEMRLPQVFTSFVHSCIVTESNLSVITVEAPVYTSVCIHITYRAGPNSRAARADSLSYFLQW